MPYGLQYQGIDVALDAYPYNGVTTTCESLFVGVPVISLHGRDCVSRSGLSILNALGLGELVASTTGQYVDIAVSLANDLTRLEKLRAELRDRFEKSPLRDEKRSQLISKNCCNQHGGSISITLSRAFTIIPCLFVHALMPCQRARFPRSFKCLI